MLFALNLATAKIKTCEYILYMSPSMEQKSKIANKKKANLLKNLLTTKMYTRRNDHIYSSLCMMWMGKQV